MNEWIRHKCTKKKEEARQGSHLSFRKVDVSLLCRINGAQQGEKILFPPFSSPPSSHLLNRCPAGRHGGIFHLFFSFRGRAWSRWSIFGFLGDVEQGWSDGNNGRHPHRACWFCSWYSCIFWIERRLCWICTQDTCLGSENPPKEDFTLLKTNSLHLQRLYTFVLVAFVSSSRPLAECFRN